MDDWQLHCDQQAMCVVLPFCCTSHWRPEAVWLYSADFHECKQLLSLSQSGHHANLSSRFSRHHMMGLWKGFFKSDKCTLVAVRRALNERPHSLCSLLLMKANTLYVIFLPLLMSAEFATREEACVECICLHQKQQEHCEHAMKQKNRQDVVLVDLWLCDKHYMLCHIHKALRMRKYRTM